MTFKQLLIEPASESNSIKLCIEGMMVATHPFLTLHLFHFGEVRMEPVWWTMISQDQSGAFPPSEIKGLRNGELYCVYVATEAQSILKNVPNNETLIFTQHFKIRGTEIEFISNETAEEHRRKMIENISAPMYAKDGHEPNAKAFQIVVFYAGVSVHYESSSKGITIRPIYPGMSNHAAFKAVSEYLLKHHSAVVPSEEELKPLLRHQPLFSITFHQVFSTTDEGAIKFISQIANDISTIIASERGDKPFPVLTFTLDCSNGDWSILPTNFDLRGNLLPPMFASSHPTQIEKLLPIIQSSPYARLILELYTQALAERDRSFRFFRQWALLEMIADKNVQSSNTPLTNLDGSPIVLPSGKQLNTSRKEGKVYALLREGALAPIHQQTLSGSVKILEGSNGHGSFGEGIEKVVSLWEAVSAAYKMRNDVAHDGKFTYYKSPQDSREELCNDFFSGDFDFLSHALNFAIWREIMN